MYIDISFIQLWEGGEMNQPLFTWYELWRDYVAGQFGLLLERMSVPSECYSVTFTFTGTLFLCVYLVVMKYPKRTIKMIRWLHNLNEDEPATSDNNINYHINVINKEVTDRLHRVNQGIKELGETMSAPPPSARRRLMEEKRYLLELSETIPILNFERTSSRKRGNSRGPRGASGDRRVVNSAPT